MSNTALEVMQAIVENGGPVEGWVKLREDKPWFSVVVTGADLDDGNDYPIISSEDCYHIVSITDPNKTYAPLGPWVNDWAKWRAVSKQGYLIEYSIQPGISTDSWHRQRESFAMVISIGHDPTNWETSLEERKRTTRPMTPREFARFVGENMGKYLYRATDWDSDAWVYAPGISSHVGPLSWLYAHNHEGELVWQELPEMEVES